MGHTTTGMSLIYCFFIYRPMAAICYESTIPIKRASQELHVNGNLYWQAGITRPQELFGMRNRKNTLEDDTEYTADKNRKWNRKT